IRQTIPVAKTGDFVILFPKWVPGGHTPRNEIEKVIGLTVTGGGKPIAWTRDTVDMYAFHLDIPKGVKSIDVRFQYATATKGDQGRIMVTPNMMSLQTIVTSFYPAGYFARQIPVKMTVKYPDGW